MILPVASLVMISYNKDADRIILMPMLAEAFF